MSGCCVPARGAGRRQPALGRPRPSVLPPRAPEGRGEPRRRRPSGSRPPHRFDRSRGVPRVCGSTTAAVVWWCWADAPSTLLDAVIAGLLLQWPGRAAGDVSVLTAAAAPMTHRSSGVAPAPWRRRHTPAKPRTGPRPPSSSAARREGRPRPGRGRPGWCSPSGRPWSARALHRDALPLSTPGAAPLVAGVEPPPAAAASSSGEVALERGPVPGPAQPWSHAVAAAPSAPARARSGSAGSRTFASPASRNRRRSLSHQRRRSATRRRSCSRSSRGVEELFRPLGLFRRGHGQPGARSGVPPRHPLRRLSL